MNEQAIRFRFGIFVLASLILLAVLVILFGGFPNYFRRTDSFTIVFANGQGITPGTPVRRSGVRIGEVRSIALNNETGKVNVEIRIDDKYFLRKGDRPTLQVGLLGGDAAIAFLPPEDKEKFDPTPVESGAVIEGVNPADAGALVQKAAELAQPVQDVLNEIKKTFAAINKLGPVAEDTLRDFREIGKMAKTVGPELQKTSEEIRLLAKSTRDIVPDVKRTNDEIQQTARYWGKVGERADVLIRTNEGKVSKTIERMEEALKRMNDVLGDENQKYIRDTLRNVKNGSQQFEKIAGDTSELVKESRVTVKQLGQSLKRADEAITDLQKVMKPLGDRGPTILKNLDESTESLARTLKEVRELIQVLARSEGTVQKLLGDPSLYNNLNDSAIMATKILPRLDSVLRDVEIFADKLARHPELIGLGGVVRPSSGLKEPRVPFRIYP